MTRKRANLSGEMLTEYQLQFPRHKDVPNNSVIHIDGPSYGFDGSSFFSNIASAGIGR